MPLQLVLLLLLLGLLLHLAWLPSLLLLLPSPLVSRAPQACSSWTPWTCC